MDNATATKAAKHFQYLIGTKANLPGDLYFTRIEVQQLPNGEYEVCYFTADEHPSEGDALWGYLRNYCADNGIDYPAVW